MKAYPTSLPDVLIIEPTVHQDHRGFFFESFREDSFNQLIGRPIHFVQDNHSRSSKGVLRGLHYQVQQPQGKLIRVIEGKIFDVAVDLRQHSPTFGQYVATILSAHNKKIIWIPEGFAHGFLVLSQTAQLLYKTTNYWMPGDEMCIKWDDPTLAINWPLQTAPVLSKKDTAGHAFSDRVMPILNEL